MLDFVLLGLIQGILEWLPVSSEGFLVLAGYLMQLPQTIDLALYLHLGTVAGVIVYFRSDILDLFKRNNPGTRTKGTFIAKATVVSLLVAFPIYLALKSVAESSAQDAGSVLLGFTGVALIVTGLLLKKTRLKKMDPFTTKNSVFVGFLQGLAVIPGLSRSGVTMFGLLGSGFEPEEALETSFLMSVPVVLAGNVFLQLTEFSFRPEYLISLFFAFVTGLASMHFLLSIAKKLDFSWFCWLFGVFSLTAFFFLI